MNTAIISVDIVVPNNALCFDNSKRKTGWADAWTVGKGTGTAGEILTLEGG